MIADEMKGPMNPEVLPTQLKRAKNNMDLGPGTTSEIMVTLYEPQAAVWNYRIRQIRGCCKLSWDKAEFAYVPGGH